MSTGYSQMDQKSLEYQPMKMLSQVMLVVGILAIFGITSCSQTQGAAEGERDPWDMFVQNPDDGQIPGVIPRNVQGSIRISGSSTAAPLVTSFSQEFTRLGFSGMISLESIGSAGAARTWIPGQTSDLLITTYPLNQEQLEELATQDMELTRFTIALDGLGIPVHPDNNWAQSVSKEELSQLFLEAQTWSDVRPSWPEIPVVRVSPGTDSGTFLSFDSQVLRGDRSLSSVPNTRFSENDDLLVQLLRVHPGSIGYLGYSILNQSLVDLPLIRIDGIELSRESVTSGRYALIRELLVYVPTRDLSSNPALAGFISFLVNAQPQALLARGFFPLSLEVQQRNYLEWNRVFHGRF